VNVVYLLFPEFFGDNPFGMLCRLPETPLAIFPRVLVENLIRPLA
jgi:hypothetical protein